MRIASADAHTVAFVEDCTQRPAEPPARGLRRLLLERIRAGR